MRFGCCVVMAAALLPYQALAQSSAAPETKSKVGVADVFSAFGFTEKRQVSGKSCRVTADVKQEDLIKSVPLLQKLDLLNSEMSQSSVRAKPTKVVMAFAIQTASLEVKSLFEDEPSVDKCSFVQTLTYLDDYGNEKTVNMYSYDFDRATYAKINWEKFQSPNLMKVAKNFNFNPVIMARVSQEAD